MFRKNLLYFVVVLIGCLLLADILFTHYNNNTMQRNRVIRNEIAQVRLYYDQIGRVLIHSLDIGLRGFALAPSRQFSQPMYNAMQWKDSIFARVETPLKDLNYN